MKMKCSCGHEEFFIEKKGNQTEIYCLNCGKRQKWANKQEINLFKFKNKNNTTNKALEMLEKEYELLERSVETLELENSILNRENRLLKEKIELNEITLEINLKNIRSSKQQMEVINKLKEGKNEF